MDGTGRNGFRGVVALTLWVCMISASPAWASDQDPASDFIAQVRNVERSTQMIEVSIGKSLLVDMNKPIDRAAVSSDEVAAVAVLSPMQLMITGKAFGATQLILWTKEGEQLLFDILVRIEIPQLIAAINSVAPNANVEAKVIQESILLLGTVPDAETAARIVEIAGIFSQSIINHMRVAGEQQVLLRCTVAEVSKNALRQLGVNGFLAGDDFRDAFFVNNIAGINPTNIGPVVDAGPVNVQNTIPFTMPRSGIPIGGATTFSVGFPRVQMQLFIQALRENSLLRVLAEPNLVAISGQTASFLAGGEFPVPVPQDQNTITIEYREFGVRLNFTPSVLGRQLIRLRVAPEVSELDFSTAVQFSGFVIPGLTQRRAETTVEMTGGQTLAIAGLLSEQVRAANSALPGLGDLPVLGALFRSVEFERRTSELVILVTPEVIAGLGPDQVPPVPGELDLEPNDWELFGLGMLEGQPVTSTAEPEDSLRTEFPVKRTGARPVNMGLRGAWGQGTQSETN